MQGIFCVLQIAGTFARKDMIAMNGRTGRALDFTQKVWYDAGRGKYLLIRKRRL